MNTQDLLTQNAAQTSAAIYAAEHGVTLIWRNGDHWYSDGSYRGGAKIADAGPQRP